jgi:hypothetical protein
VAALAGYEGAINQVCSILNIITFSREDGEGSVYSASNLWLVCIVQGSFVNKIKIAHEENQEIKIMNSSQTPGAFLGCPVQKPM